MLGGFGSVGRSVDRHLIQRKRTSLAPLTARAAARRRALRESCMVDGVAALGLLCRDCGWLRSLWLVRGSAPAMQVHWAPWACCLGAPPLHPKDRGGLLGGWQAARIARGGATDDDTRRACWPWAGKGVPWGRPVALVPCMSILAVLRVVAFWDTYRARSRRGRTTAQVQKCPTRSGSVFDRGRVFEAADPSRG